MTEKTVDFELYDDWLPRLFDAASRLFGRSTDRVTPNDRLSIFQALTGDAFQSLPAPIRDLQGTKKARVWAGTAQVRQGETRVGRLIGRLLGVPQKAGIWPVRVAFMPDGQGERWVRHFGDTVFTSVHRLGAGRNAGLMIARFGVIKVGVEVTVAGQRLALTPRRLFLCGLPMPAALVPTGTSTEAAKDGRFRFDANVTLPIFGRIVDYAGWLEPVEESAF